jgi:phosphoserine aminotransferase
MNATFLLNDETHAATFDAMWKAAGISGLPGHRSVAVIERLCTMHYR